MKYFLLTDLGYDGIMCEVFNDEAKALSEYKYTASNTVERTGKNLYRAGNNFGVMLIKGEVVSSKDFDYE